MRNERISVWQIVLWVALFVISIVFVILAIKFQDRLLHFQSFGLIGIFIINFFGSATIFFPSPAIASVIAGGAVYPPLIVGLVATAGTALGDMVGYLLGLSTTHIFLKKDHHWYDVVTGLFKRYGGLIIFLFSMIPNPIFDAVSLIAGALNYSPWKFFLWLFLGRLVRNMALAFFGARF